jgi:tetratricopeptide (TPR) repeat protein
MICPACKTRNPVGSKFCRECGAKLPLPDSPLYQEEAAKAEVERQQERAAELLAKAFTAREAGKIDDAIVWAKEAAELLPASTSAFALLAALYERTGQRDLAALAMEKVVALNPDSEADRLKLSQLKRSAAPVPSVVLPASGTATPTTARPVGIVSPVPQANRASNIPDWVPPAVAGGVIAFVLCIGFAVVNQGKESKGRSPASPVVAVSPQAQTPSPVNPESAPVVTPAQAYLPPSANASRPDPFAPVPGMERPRQRVAAASATGTSGGVTLPGPRRRAGTVSNGSPAAPAGTQTPLPPAAVLFNGANGNTAPITSANGGLPAINGMDANSGGGFGAGGRLSVGPPQAPQPSQPAPPAPDNGYIRIQVGPGGGRGNGGSGEGMNPNAPGPNGGRGNNGNNEPAPPAPEVSPLTRARRLHTSGKYEAAIAAYREALMQGGGGDAYLGMGQSYQRLGNDAAAITAYRDAIGAYEAQAQTGGQNSYAALTARRGIASCRAALEVLGG